MLAIRLSRPYAELVSVIDTIWDHCGQLIVYEHQADANVSRTHVHMLVDALQVSTETVKNWLRQDSTTEWTKSDWSFKKQYRHRSGKIVLCDADMITYMSKGKLNPCRLPKGFPDWKEKMELWVEPVKYQTTLDQKKEPSARNTITQWDMFEEVDRYLKYDADGNFTKRHILMQDVVDAILHVHLKHHKLISRYKVRDFYDTYVARNDRSEIARKIYNLIDKT